jgi:UDP-glucose 4-epimerase
VSILRLANVIGPRVETAMTAYFTLPLIPTVMGFDARLQFIHEDDAITALHRAVTGAVTGVFNIAGDGVLALSQAVRRTGRPAISVPAGMLGVVGRALAPTRLVDFSAEQVQRELGFTAKRTASAAFDEFLAGHDLRPGFVNGILDGAASLLSSRGAAHA